MKLDDRRTEAHNEFQRSYFERARHRTLNRPESVYLRRHVNQIVRFAGIEPGMRILEVGCGTGRYTLILAELGIKVEGLDLSPQLLEQLQENNAGRFDIPTHGFDLAASPPEMYGQFDAVIGFFVLHHVHGLDVCLDIAAQLAKPGGSVAFLEPNPRNPLYYVQITLTPEMSWRGEKGIFQMRSNVLLPSMERAGLSELSVRRFGFFPAFVTNLKVGPPLEDALERIPILKPILPFQLFGGRRPASAGVAASSEEEVAPGPGISEGPEASSA
jgi:2-polyprenyl-3-methyl-5-hydroxy-6-metoxy-1,4-benzoquinol methylase